MTTDFRSTKKVAVKLEREGNKGNDGNVQRVLNWVSVTLLGRKNAWMPYTDGVRSWCCGTEVRVVHLKRTI